jgi:UDP-glucose 4-epimerase
LLGVVVPDARDVKTATAAHLYAIDVCPRLYIADVIFMHRVSAGRLSISFHFPRRIRDGDLPRSCSDAGNAEQHQNPEAKRNNTWLMMYTAFGWHAESGKGNFELGPQRGLILSDSSQLLRNRRW